MRRIRGFTLVELPAVSERRRNAFTLVELLVVIGIIALLISILLPALAAARRQAMTTKCAAQMHDMGNAMQMYAQDNKGYLPPARLNTQSPNGSPYTIDNLTYHKGPTEVYGSIINENPKWWHFIAKYVTKKKPMPQAGDSMSEYMTITFWCPAFPGDTDAGSNVNLIDGINRNITGIAFNQYPTFSGDHPVLGTDFPPANETFADCTSASGGKWYKLTQFTHPSERALLGDGSQYYLEAKAIPSSAAIPGQRLIFSTKDFSNGVSGQTTFDFYRHGIYPRVANSDQDNGYFSATGGKISYNILYTDGHVQTATDRETGYRACRMRFPN